MPTYELQRGSLTVELRQDTPPTQAQIDQAFTAASAREEGQQRPGVYLRKTLGNVPRDLVNQGAGLVGLVNTLGGATAELGTDIGSVIREAVGLQPHYQSARPNQAALAAMPRALVNHYAGYLDPNERALMVREHPVGLALDVVGGRGVAAGAKAGVKAGVSKAGAAGPVIRAGYHTLRGQPLRATSAIVDAIEAQARSVTPASAAPAAPAAAPPAPPVPAAGSPVARTAPPAPRTSIVGATPNPPASAPKVPAPHDTAGRTLHVRWADRTTGQQSAQSVRNDLGIAAKRASPPVALTEPEMEAAAALVRAGKTPVEAVAEMAKMAPAVPVAATKTAAATTTESAMPRMRMTPDETKAYHQLRSNGKTDLEAKLSIAQQRELTATTGATPLPKAKARIATRQATGRWPEGAP